MAEILVTASELTSKAGTLRTYNQNFKKNISDLEQQESKLISMWDGEAKNAFHKAFTNDKQQWDNFYNLIEQYCLKLEEIAKRYQKAEAENTNTASTRTY